MPKNYGLRASHYLSVPALRWDAMLSTTKVKLHLTLDLEIHLLFGKGMGGGVSYISKDTIKQAIFNII